MSNAMITPSSRGGNDAAGRLDNTDFQLVRLIPAVRVAWADGAVDSKEREEILRMAGQTGLQEGGKAYKQLLNWLDQEPSLELYKYAERIIDQVLRNRSRLEAAMVAQELKQRSEGIAMVSRSLWGMGPRVSSGEQRVLEMLARDFRPFTIPMDQV